MLILIFVVPCRSVCDRFNGPSVRRVTTALYARAPHFVQWPTGDRAIQAMHNFEQKNAFPRIIGIVDGTHIQINAPQENAADYINLKGYHSLQL